MQAWIRLQQGIRSPRLKSVKKPRVNNQQPTTNNQQPTKKEKRTPKNKTPFFGGGGRSSPSFSFVFFLSVCFTKRHRATSATLRCDRISATPRASESRFGSDLRCNERKGKPTVWMKKIKKYANWVGILVLGRVLLFFVCLFGRSDEKRLRWKRSEKKCEMKVNAYNNNKKQRHSLDIIKMLTQLTIRYHKLIIIFLFQVTCQRLLPP